MNRATLILQQVLAHDQDRHDLRRLLIRVALDAGDIPLAEEHLKVLTDSVPEDAEASELRGRLLERRRQYVEARACFAQALKTAPHLLESYQHLAFLLRTQYEPDPKNPKKKEQQAAEADRVMNDLIAKNPANFKAFLAHCHYLLQYMDFFEEKKFQQAREDVDRAKELAPDEPEVLIARAEIEEMAGGDLGVLGSTTLGMLGSSPPGSGPVLAAYFNAKRGRGRDQACKILRDGLERHPQEPGLYRALVAVLRDNPTRHQEALECLQQALKTLPSNRHYEFLWIQANLLIDQGHSARSAAAKFPKDSPEAKQRIQQSDSALAEAEQPIAELRKTANSSAIDFLEGRICLVEGKWSEAARLLERARPALEELPDVGSQINLFLALCYENLGDPAGQERHWNLLVRNMPGSLPYHLGLANTLAAQGKLDSAIEEYRKVIALPQAPPAAWLEIARLLIQRDPKNPQVNEALDLAEKALKAEESLPPRTTLTLLRAQALVAQNQWQNAYEKVCAACREDKDFQQPRLHLAQAILLDQKGEKDNDPKLKDEAHHQFDGIEDHLKLTRKQAQTDEQRQAGNRALADLRVARAQFWARQPKKPKNEEARLELTQLVQGLDSLKPEDQNRVLQAVAEAQTQHQNWEEAETLWSQLADKTDNQKDKGLHLLLCQLAKKTSHETVMRPRWTIYGASREGRAPTGAWRRLCVCFLCRNRRTPRLRTWTGPANCSKRPCASIRTGRWPFASWGKWPSCRTGPSRPSPTTRRPGTTANAVRAWGSTW